LVVKGTDTNNHNLLSYEVAESLPLSQTAKADNKMETDIKASSCNVDQMET
jgi:hypothetical protein